MDVVEMIRKTKLVAIARKVPAERIVDAAQALFDGGIRNIEITFNQASPSCIEDASASIGAVKKAMEGRMLVGAGTVLSVEQAEAAYEAGADFVLSPDTNIKVIAEVKRLGMVSVPGALTPSEIMAAWNAGADIVKMFPAGLFGLPYLKAIRGPINQVPLMAVGGVGEENVKEFLENGFCSCGIGSNLVRNDLILSGSYRQLADLAKQFVDAAK
nr:hypothetical protein [uncultured bacterium]